MCKQSEGLSRPQATTASECWVITGPRSAVTAAVRAHMGVWDGFEILFEATAVIQPTKALREGWAPGGGTGYTAVASEGS